MEANKDRLKKYIKEHSLKTDQGDQIISSNGKKSEWLFDIKDVVMNPEILSDIVEIFWEKCGDLYPFQVGGMETASIPIISAIVLDSHKRGVPVNGFYMRKSRNKTGLQKRIEGIINDEKIILIDDIVNSGKSLQIQMDVLMQEKKRKVDHVFCVIRYREQDDYVFLQEGQIDMKSIFDLSDFNMPFIKDKNDMPHKYYEQLWKFHSSRDVDYFDVVPKSTPVIDEEKIYFGTDSGTFFALNQHDGSVVWQHKIYAFERKGIFSSPTLHKGCVYFGAYDGNMYCLDAKTGKRIWMYSGADWIGSSPTVSEKNGLVYVGLEFGLFKRQGGIVALDLMTGKKKWHFMMDKMTHSSPLYIPQKDMVVIGNNNGSVYAFHAASGVLKWTANTGGDIKDSFVFDEDENCVFCGSMDGKVYGFNVKNGEKFFEFSGDFGVYSTPCLYRRHVIFSCLDKKIYCYDLQEKKLRWKFHTNGRSFPRPVVIDENIFVGSNDGRLYEIDFNTGKLRSFFQATERIVNDVVYNEKTKRFFVLTHANELYCLCRQMRSCDFGQLVK